MIDTTLLRRWIGRLGMYLPWIVLGLSLVFGYGFPDSISQTYYFEPCITPFMIILGAAGLLLICYKGYDKQDKIICTLAGVFGWGICIFPCAVSSWLDADGLVGTLQIPVEISGWIHNISAITFFGLLAYNSLFLFTKSGGEMTENKKKRNIIFRVCGVGMVVSFVLLLLPIPHITWIVEAIALAFFGVSWLTKADYYPWLFADKKN